MSGLLLPISESLVFNFLIQFPIPLSGRPGRGVRCRELPEFPFSPDGFVRGWFWLPELSWVSVKALNGAGSSCSGQAPALPPPQAPLSPLSEAKQRISPR